MVQAEETDTRRSGGRKEMGPSKHDFQTAGHDPLLDYEISLVSSHLHFAKKKKKKKRKRKRTEWEISAKHTDIVL